MNVSWLLARQVSAATFSARTAKVADRFTPPQIVPRQGCMYSTIGTKVEEKKIVKAAQTIFVRAEVGDKEREPWKSIRHGPKWASSKVSCRRPA